MSHPQSGPDPQLPPGQQPGQPPRPQPGLPHPRSGPQPQAGPAGQPPYGYPAPYPAAPSPERYAHWGRRALGFLIDYVGVAVVYYAIGGVLMALSAATGLGSSSTGAIVLGIVGVVLNLALVAFAFWNTCYRRGTTGQSLGQSAAKIRTISDLTGHPLGVGNAFLRQLCHFFDGLACYLGFLWPLWDPKRQTFADKMVSSAVVPADQHPAAPFPPAHPQAQYPAAQYQQAQYPTAQSPTAQYPPAPYPQSQHSVRQHAADQHPQAGVPQQNFPQPGQPQHDQPQPPHPQLPQGQQQFPQSGPFPQQDAPQRSSSQQDAPQQTSLQQTGESTRQINFPQQSQDPQQSPKSDGTQPPQQ